MTLTPNFHATPCAPHLPRAAAAMRIPLAGGVDETIMSEVSAVILPYFTMAEATALRLVCREFLEAVRDYQWEDSETVILGSIAAWRGSFPRARCANVRKYDLKQGFRRAKWWMLIFCTLWGCES